MISATCFDHKNISKKKKTSITMKDNKNDVKQIVHAILNARTENSKFKRQQQSRTEQNSQNEKRKKKKKEKINNKSLPTEKSRHFLYF